VTPAAVIGSTMFGLLLLVCVLIFDVALGVLVGRYLRERDVLDLGPYWLEDPDADGAIERVLAAPHPVPTTIWNVAA